MWQMCGRCVADEKETIFVMTAVEMVIFVNRRP